MRAGCVRSRAGGTAGLSAANWLEHAREAAPPAAPLEAQPHRPCTAPTAAGTARARRAERAAAQRRGRRIGERGMRGTPPRAAGAPGRRRPLVVLPRGEARPSRSTGTGLRGGTGERRVMGSQAARKAAARRSAAPRSGSRREPRAIGYTQRPGHPGALPRAIHPPDTPPGQAPRRAPLPAAPGTAPPKWRSSALPTALRGEGAVRLRDPLAFAPAATSPSGPRSPGATLRAHTTSPRRPSPPPAGGAASAAVLPLAPAHAQSEACANARADEVDAGRAEGGCAAVSAHAPSCRRPSLWHPD